MPGELTDPLSYRIQLYLPMRRNCSLHTSCANNKFFCKSVFQVTAMSVDEPDFSTAPVNLPVIRNAGTLGNVVVQWVAAVNGKLATDDLRVASGNLSFAAGQTVRNLLIEIMPDNIPEAEEVRNYICGNNENINNY